MTTGLAIKAALERAEIHERLARRKLRVRVGFQYSEGHHAEGLVIRATFAARTQAELDAQHDCKTVVRYDELDARAGELVAIVDAMVARRRGGHRRKGRRMTARPFHEPEENEAREALLRDEQVERGAALYAGLLSGLLDQIEESVRRAVDHGLEAELRERLAKLLPAAPLTAAPSGPAPATPEAAPARYTAEQLNLLIGIMHASRALEEHARRARADSHIAKRDTASRDFLRALGADIKSGRLVAAVPLTCLNTELQHDA